MPVSKSKAIRLFAQPQADGLHLVIPASIVRPIVPARSEGPVEMYAVMTGKVIQFSCHEFKVAIPALCQDTEEFAPAQE